MKLPSLAQSMAAVLTAGLLVRPSLAGALGVLVAGALSGLEVWMAHQDAKMVERIEALENLRERVSKVEKDLTEDHLLLVKVSNRTSGR